MAQDITIYELLDPLSSLITADPARGRARVAAVQPLCERVPLHTDGKETRHAWARWWTLLAAADPIALIHLAVLALLAHCNDPNSLLHGARHDLWRAWKHRGDPMVVGALRLTLDAPLDADDPQGLARLGELTDGTGSDAPANLMTMLQARIDERPFRYSYTNSDELLARDAQQVNELNFVANQARVPQVTPIPRANGSSSSEPIRPSAPASPSPDLLDHLEAQIPATFPSGAVGLARSIRRWRSRRYDDAGPNWALDRVANIFGYRMIELAEAGREEEAAVALRSIADAAGLGDRSGVLAALAQGLERNGQLRLATIAYTLTWTRARGHGGWLTFGGETEIASLRRAAELDRALTLDVIAQETEQIISRGRYGTYGISQALIFGFAVGGLGGADEPSVDMAFRAWDRALSVIAHRAPRVHPTDDPDEPYTVSDPDDGAEILGDLDPALATAALAGLAHPARENKRRSLLAAQLLLAERSAAAAPAFKVALANLSDPATLTWLLRVLEHAGELAGPVITRCAPVLRRLASGPHLTVRTLARRLIGEVDSPMPPPTPADSALLTTSESEVLWTPVEVTSERDTIGSDELVDSVAGTRLARAEKILPGLGDAVRTRVSAAMVDEHHKKRMNAQLDAFADRIEKRWPDAYLTSEEAIEDALQRAAAGGRAARISAGLPISDPAAWEEELAAALLDDPFLPLALEATRQPRPAIPPPPEREHSVWSALRSSAEGSVAAENEIETAIENNGLLLGTLTIAPLRVEEEIDAGIFCGWSTLATLERRVCPPRDRYQGKDDVSQRFRIAELRNLDDRRALALPPVASGDIRAWMLPLPPGLSLERLTGSQPIIGIDHDLAAAGDAHHGLGIQTPLLVPTPSLIAVLGLHPGKPFVLDDEEGPALALITWRTEYETSEYHLTWPRLRGSAVVIRKDKFLHLTDIADGQLMLRDFVVGDAELVAAETDRRDSENISRAGPDK